MANNSFFLVLEGSDGSGKATQQQLLVERLRQEGYEVETVDFPRYHEPSSHFVRRYLNGEYGTAEEVGPYTAAMFFALDRYEAIPDIREALDAGKIVIANRYTGSSMAHLGGKFDNVEERKGFFLWMDAIEFQMLRVPRPDISLVLRIPAEISQKLIDKKDKRAYTDKKRDLHEADLYHLQNAVEAYDNLCELFPRDFKALDCTRNSELMNVDAIHKLIWESITPLLPSKPKKHTPTPNKKVTYHVPRSLDNDTKASYKELLDKILSIRSEIAKHLADYNVDQSVLNLLLPIASDKEMSKTITARASHKTNSVPVLREHYSIDSSPLRLVSVSPRNEFDCLPKLLFPHSANSISEISDQVSEWQYDKKLSILQEFLSNTPVNVLEEAEYTFEIISDYSTYKRVGAAWSAATIQHQAFTPRNGYEVPQDIQEAGLGDQWEECFDLSLKLFSVLQSSGTETEAQLATLCGHKIRWDLTLSLADLYETRTTLSNEQVYQHIIEKVAEVHPVLAGALFNAN